MVRISFNGKAAGAKGTIYVKAAGQGNKRDGQNIISGGNQHVVVTDKFSEAGQFPETEALGILTLLSGKGLSPNMTVISRQPRQPGSGDGFHFIL